MASSSPTTRNAPGSTLSSFSPWIGHSSYSPRQPRPNSDGCKLWIKSLSANPLISKKSLKENRRSTRRWSKGLRWSSRSSSEARVVDRVVIIRAKRQSILTPKCQIREGKLSTRRELNRQISRLMLKRAKSCQREKATSMLKEMGNVQFQISSVTS